MPMIKIFWIIFVLLIMLAGAYLWYDDYQRQKRRRNIALSDDLQDKDGIPVIPRHLRKFSQQHNNQTTENPYANSQPTVKAEPQTLATTNQQASAPVPSPSTATDNPDYHHNSNFHQPEQSDVNSSESPTVQSSTTESKPTTVFSQTFSQSEFEEGVETKMIRQTDARHKYQMPSNYGQTAENNTTDALTNEFNTEVIDSTDVQFDTDIEFQTDDFDTDIEFDTRLHGELADDMPQNDVSANPQDNNANNHSLENSSLDNGFLESSSLKSSDTATASPQYLSDTDTAHKIHYTAGNYQQANEMDNAQANNAPVDSVDDAFSDLAQATQSLSTGYEDIEQSANQTTSQFAGDSSTIRSLSEMSAEADRKLIDNSPFLDQHLQLSDEMDNDPNSPLNNARDNLNISILPFNEFSHISGEKVLNMVDDFGFKFGTMNMFHRYQNKDGSGVLWFSMMGLTNNGIVPFDLNSLPTSMNLKGLVMFLPLPHPKVLQGFDSMMSIAGLIAREVNGYIVDEDGNEIDADYKKKLRALLQSHLIESE